MRPLRAAGAALLLALLVGCGSDGTNVAATSSTTTTEAPRPRMAHVGELPAFRPGVDRPEPDRLAHGDSGWGVYLALGRTTPGEGTVDRSDWDAALDELRARGFPVAGAGGEVACDGDAAVAAVADLDVDLVTAVYFHDRADADAYAASLDPAPRVVPVTYYCAD